ncbi:group II intron reverse transcriptase/maturase [Methylomarinum sp. Ch1-1]|uniref:Group II intron reverse transcriptase/maturase n=2 Tax=Methylomarinum roseum TaxID=3067653 RepID=A0AAU7NT65_9GAMM|nr:group II intron reverse transcriptase/maturase [Methylomarinum sp. Ch1-1]MDP4519831.1 group II intron reverse transcriptase/maturase [Methylomarinum sp. Ch1-1]
MPRNEETVTTKLQRIAEKARNEPNCQFTSLFHLMTVEMLWGCFDVLRNHAASGIDGVTKQQYENNLLENLQQLVGKLHRMAYLPQPVQRVYIPKPGTDKLRPLGIPALEDKLVQAGLVKILQAIYEQDFIDDSYGFRPGKSCHDALRALSQTVENRPINHIVEADIKGFFDTVDQEQLMTFLAHRIADKRVLRYIKRFLKAGIVEDGQFKASETGTPQGGVISPLLANLYLHYSLDLWMTRKFAKSCGGVARMIRYADDFVVCFQQEADAKRFRNELEARLALFELTLAPEKTQCIEFGPLAVKRARARGEKAATFDFLGFTHYCSRTRDGKRFRMKRKTIGKRLTAKLKAYRAWLKANRNLPTAEILKRTARKLRGHYGYYGVTDNSRGINLYFYQVQRILHKWLNRRGRRNCCSWAKFALLLARFPLPKPKILVNLF